ncbi:MAG: hypothetical protein H6585_08465 [Flavobacteriales bacterium]|nr:hypothetical protein [Flavobacteriales bacterium]MCB9448362.1 hypothetical protein [Flavobacteriales bacterium]
MMKWLWTGLCMWPFCVVGQETSMLNIRVRYPVSVVTVDMPDTVLYTDHVNPVKVEITGKDHLASVQLLGGEMHGAKGTYTAFVKEGTEAVLLVTSRKPNGKLQVAYSKNLPIVHLADPVPMIGGVKHDSIIRREDMLATGKLYAKLNRFGTTNVLQILSFDMLAFNGVSFDTLSSASERLTPEMRRTLYYLKDGNPVYFENISCRMPDGETRRLKSMRIFVDCRNRWPGVTE